MSSYITYNITEFIQSKSTTAARLEAIEVCIDNAILLLAEAASGENDNLGGTIEEYQLDDSQVKIRTRYRSIEDIERSISALEKMRNRYLNQLRGRQVIMKDIRTFRR